MSHNKDNRKNANNANSGINAPLENRALAEFPPLFNVRQAARALALPERHLQKLLARGAIPGFKTGGVWRMRQADIKALVHSRHTPATRQPARSRRSSSSGSRNSSALAASARA